jgi:thioredoxin-related protein
MVKSLIFAFALVFVATTPSWLTNMDSAKTEASQSHKLILLSFSGSDWCAPCIRMKHEVFETDAFLEYATDKLVLVRADFPRNKKNILDKRQVKQNEALAEKYNPNGKFPFTVLLDADGKVIREWDGYHKETPEEFVNQVSEASNGK